MTDRKFAAAFALLLSAVMLFSGCGLMLNEMNGDWKYALPNNYIIIRTSAFSIHLSYKKTDTSAHPVTSDYTLGFQYNDRYVVLKCTSDPQWKTKYEGAPFCDEATLSWILFDTAEKKTVGSFDNEKDYENKLAELGITDMCDWIDTYPMPKGAIAG